MRCAATASKHPGRSRASCRSPFEDGVRHSTVRGCASQFAISAQSVCKFADRYFDEKCLRCARLGRLAGVRRHRPGRLDLGRGANKPPQNLVGRRVGDIQTAPYAAKTYLQSLGRHAGIADCAWVAPDEALSHLEQAKWIAKNVAPERIALRVDSLADMVEAV